jgi:hypothetical protein
MSSIVIAGDTSGTVTLQAPAEAGSTVLNLPTVSGGTLVTSDSSGDVIVGSTVTATGLGAIERFRIIGAGSGLSGGPSAFAQFRYANDSNGVFYRSYKSRSNTVNGHTALQLGDLAYQFSCLGSDGTTWTPIATISAFVNGTVSSGVTPGSLVFYTANTSGANTERFAALANGNFKFDSGYGSSAVAYGCRAWVNFNGTGNSNLTGTYSQTGTIVTVSITGHGYVTGQSAFLDFTSGTASDGAYTVTVTDANTFTVPQAVSRTTSGNVTSVRNTIRASGNVSSITDNGTGDYTINFITAMPDANYAASVNGLSLSSTDLRRGASIAGDATTGATLMTTTALKVIAGNPSTGSLSDIALINVAIFR